MNENDYIVNQVSLRFVPEGPTDSTLSLVRVMAWHRKVAKPLPEAVINLLNDAYMCHWALMT